MKYTIQILSKSGDDLRQDTFYSAEAAALFCWGKDMSRLTFFYRGQPIPGDLPCDITGLERFLKSHVSRTDAVCGGCSPWSQYRRKGLSEMRPYIEGEVLPPNVSISEADRKNGSPKAGDMVARNPKNHDDQWLVAERYFLENLEPA